MQPMSLRKWIAAGAAVGVLAASSVIAQQQQAQLPARGNHDWAPKVTQGKSHSLAATLDTVQWGWLDPRETPRLTIDSGDTVSIETMMHSHDKVQPGMTIEQAVDLRKANPGGGPHSMLPLLATAVVAATGNIYAGLWYPIGVAVMTLIVGSLFLRDTRGVDIVTSSGVEIQKA